MKVDACCCCLRCCWYCWRCHCWVRRCSLESRTHAGGTRRLSCQRQPSILDGPPGTVALLRPASVDPPCALRALPRQSVAAAARCLGGLVKKTGEQPWGGGITTSLEDTNEEAPKRPALAGKLLGSPQQQVSSASRPSSEQRPGQREGGRMALDAFSAAAAPPPARRSNHLSHKHGPAGDGHLMMACCRSLSSLKTASRSPGTLCA